MKGLFATIIAVFITAFASAQTTGTEQIKETVEYRIDYYRPDSLYLVEVRTKDAQPGIRAQTTEIPLLLSSVEQIDVVLQRTQETEDKYRKALLEYIHMRQSIATAFSSLKYQLEQKKSK